MDDRTNNHFTRRNHCPITITMITDNKNVRDFWGTDSWHENQGLGFWKWGARGDELIEKRNFGSGSGNSGAFSRNSVSDRIS